MKKKEGSPLSGREDEKSSDDLKNVSITATLIKDQTPRQAVLELIRLLWLQKYEEDWPDALIAEYPWAFDEQGNPK